MEKTAILAIHGRVQGVGFRYFVKQKADFLQISGFVKNLPDKSVYIEAEGEEAQLNLFIGFCKQGPWHSQVRDVNIQYCPVQNFTGFEIR